MADPVRSRRRGRSSLSAQILRVAVEGRERIEQHWIARILTLLSDDALKAAASREQALAEGLHIECGFADRIWSHAEVQARVRQLADRGVNVQLVEHVTHVAGRQFSRPQILVRLAG